ncbi:hypothetical protein [Nocardioides sp.]|uniref:hypothetical protein n=1 Tax=Nocardioides sp. TaxID=35761 RepID=UPI001A326465|nr:hypothetical protein [Nocardioides sp.]MBJ7356649.1 hypothetical protein [Nocardioides sp.]
MTVLRETRGALTDAVLVVADAARLLVRHLPALLTVFLLGLACRNAAMWGAVVLGRDHVVLASLLVPLAPLSMVTALVLMLRIAGGALTADPEGERSTSRRVAVLTSALIPFLTVYTLTGQLTADRDQFINESYADEWFNGDSLVATGEIADRSLATVVHWQLILIAVVLVIRFVIDVLDLEERHTAWGLVQALVEVTWLTWLATMLTSELRDVWDWVGARVVVDWLQDAWSTVTGWFGPFTDPLRAVGDLLSALVEGVGGIVVTPVAWLAVGAVVIAGGLPASRRARLELPDRAQHLHARVAPALARWRAPRSRATAKTLELLGRRFADLVDGLRILVHAGLLPVLAFCLVLPLARLAEWGAAEGLRALLGPRDPDTMIAFSRYLDIVTEAAYTVVVVAIVVAAVDRLLLRKAAAPQQGPGPDPDPDPEPVTAYGVSA